MSKPNIMISSTARDLPEHRKEVMDACLRQGMFPMMMEHMPASDQDAIAESLRVVDEADIYLGIFAHRYGYVPKENNPQQISITEMEYNRAVERSIPRLIFLMHDDHPIKAGDVEKGESAVKLERLKQRLGTERVVNFFISPADLRAHVINSLSHYRERDQTVFHYVSDIPKPPEAYIAHPYTLLQTRDLIGRQPELNLLTDWVAKPDADVYQARIFNFVAIGGMGKSALTWKWFNDIAPHEMKPLAGRMWWSFYESDARFQNFVIRGLAYVTGRAREDIEKNTKPGEREEQLLAALDQKAFLIVLDGLERILIAYARMDANRLADDDLDEQTANVVAGELGLPESAAQSFIGQHRLRKTADPRAGNFLRKLSRIRASKILVSTRLYPADLQIVTGDSAPGSFAYFLRGLSDDDALSLWRAFNVSGTREELLRLFHSFDKHPLLIHALASKIAGYRSAPRDFDQWRKDHLDFNPFSLPLVQARSHVLAFALHGLDESTKKVLYTIAAFRMPATYDTLVALLVGDSQAFANENGLDAAMLELEDRGLLGWDRRANRYDLHPIVRGVIWTGLGKQDKQNIYGQLQAHFNAIPAIADKDIKEIDDLTPAIELYDKLIGLERYDDAWNLFDTQLMNGLMQLHASRQMTELGTMLFPDGLDQMPHLSSRGEQHMAMTALALSLHLSGQPGRAARLSRSASKKAQELADGDNDLFMHWGILAYILCLLGALREAEMAARHSLVTARKTNDDEGVILAFWGLNLTVRGIVNTSSLVLESAIRQTEEFARRYIAQRSLWLEDMDAAYNLANQAWQSAQAEAMPLEIIGAARLQGAVALRMGDLDKAEERLTYALTRAREVNHVEEELPALIDFAQLRCHQGDLKAASEMLDDVWESAERGPYPLFHADALNVLAQIERDAGNTIAAIEAATQAYRKAWCDGPPFAYHWGLEAARAHLNALGAPEPSDLPPYDESKHEPMPEIEIDPPDAPVDTPADDLKQ